MNSALYYPTIEFQDYAWLWNASLLWDRIYRIIPDGYEPDEPENVRRLVEEGEIGIPLHPGAYTREVAHEFLSSVDTGKWQAAALVFEIGEAYARLHEDKVDVNLRELLIAKGKATAQDEWLHVPTEFEALYMTFLAERISKRNKLHLLSDSQEAWTGATYFKYDGHIESFLRDDSAHQLAVLVMRDFLPQNILQLNPMEIVKFRQKYRDERQRFLSAIQNAAREISGCEDERVYEDQIEGLKKEIEEALSDYKKSMGYLKILGWTGIQSVSFPVVTKVGAAIAGRDLAPETLTVISALGVGLGLVSGLADLREKRKRLERECDFSYLLHLRRNWKECAPRNYDYNYILHRKMEEFIDD